MPFEDKVKLLAEIDAYARAKDPRVRQVSASLAGDWQAVQIMRADGSHASDIRPLVRLNVSVVVGDGDRKETGSYGTGGRTRLRRVHPRPMPGSAQVDEALRQALVNLASVAAPAGEMPVVLGPGLARHPAARGDRPRARRRFQPQEDLGLRRPDGRSASPRPGVTVVDDGTIDDRRGSLTIDDEGTPTERTTLIEDGILVGYMQDRQNARLMGMQPTGNGRRESFAHVPMPRMRNTYHAGAATTIRRRSSRSVKNGLYAVNFGGGQVDITSGKFVFSCTEAYLIEDGKIGARGQGRDADRQRPGRADAGSP